MILNKQDLPEILIVKQVGDYLRLSKTTVSRWADQEIITPFKKVRAKNGYIRYFSKKDLLNYVEDALER